MKRFNILAGLVICFSSMAWAQDHGHDHDHGHEHGEEAVELSQESQALGGIKTQSVKASVFSQKLAVTGRVAQDVEDVQYVYPPAAGEIKELKASLGALVHKDELLLTMGHKDNKDIEVKSPAEGTVISVLVKANEQVDQVSALYAIADLSKLSANFDVYEKDLGQVKVGQKVLVHSMAYPDQMLEGRIVFISPRVEETTFTIKIKAAIDNKEHLLKLGMPVRGEVVVEDGKTSIVIPASAIQTIDNETVVFKKEDGRFKPQEVALTLQNKDEAVIREGLKEGDEIVVEGSFILKSKMLESEMEHGHSH